MPQGIDGNGQFDQSQEADGVVSCGALIRLILKLPILNLLNSGYSILLLKIPTLQEDLLYFNLGNISEDVLKDSRRFYENGLSTPTIPTATTTSTWGKSPLNPMQVTQAFSNDPADRPFQDVGFDGLEDIG